MGYRQVILLGLVAAFLDLFTDDVIAEVDTLIADENRGARNQLAYFVLALAAESAVMKLAIVARGGGIVALSVKRDL